MPALKSKCLAAAFPWNGSKEWLVPELKPIFGLWNGRGRYFEPFVGGGSVTLMSRTMFRCPQYLADANPWLVSAFDAQIKGCSIHPDYSDVKFWRNLTDADLPRLTVAEKANRFAICLYTAWGNRWETRADGSFRQTVNPRFCDPVYLKRRLDHFFSVRWLTNRDAVACKDWRSSVSEVRPGDMVYLDPPYPESLGYGNQYWRFLDLLDMVDWVADAIERGVSVVVSNIGDVERLYRRIGMETRLVVGPKALKTRRDRGEVIAWHIQESG